MTKIFNVSLPTKVFELLDYIADKEMRKRSEMLKVMIFHYLATKYDSNVGETIPLKEVQKRFNKLGKIGKSFKKLME